MSTLSFTLGVVETIDVSDVSTILANPVSAICLSILASIPYLSAIIHKVTNAIAINHCTKIF